jgi:hypothetical protein
MNTQNSALESVNDDETHGVTAAPAPSAAETEKKVNNVTSEEDEVRQMTLNTSNPVQKSVQSQTAGIVTKQPIMVQRMKPENYIVKPEQLRDAPDYIDCPYCKSRQKTRVQHQPTSQTSYVVAYEQKHKSWSFFANIDTT